MLDKSILFQAKSFLCWDKFHELTIKLVPIQETVGFFYPPQNDLSSIVIFYQSAQNDVTKSLCFLFHEIGHYVQWELSKDAKEERSFFELMQIDKGTKKVEFEREAWIRGRALIEEFLNTNGTETNSVLDKYDEMSVISLKSYQTEKN